MADNDLLQAALSYAAGGWPVLPLRPRGKEPLTAHGFKSATTDRGIIAAWWRRWPDANVGIATGGASGVMVLDVDPRNGGDDALYDLEQQHGPLPETVESLTGGGGRHILFRCPDGVGCGKLAEGIDVKAAGGYIVAPPSIHPSGRPYVWEVLHHPDDVALADPPPWLLALLNAPKAAAPPGTVADRIPMGMRNSTLTSLAGAMRRKGMSQAAIESALLAENSARCDPPLPEGEVKRIAQSIGRYAPAQSANALPRINASERDLRALSEACWAAIYAGNDPPRLFLHGDEIVRLEQGEQGPVLRHLDAGGLRHEAARAAQWYAKKLVGGAWQEFDAAPPRDVIEDMLAYPLEQLQLPPVTRIVRTPVFAPDGTLLVTKGYHPAGRVVIYPPPGIPPVPQTPDRQTIASAVALIDEMIADFPFCNGADRAHAFALLLLPFVRDLIDGPTPLHLIEAPTPGTGKGLLATVLLLPATGGDLGTTTQGRDEDEWRKRLTTWLRECREAVLIDNVTVLDSGALSAALTAWPLWSDRLLGTLQPLSLPIRCAWVATGNNPTLSMEIARRCIRIRVDAKQDRPYQRAPESFRHPDLRMWAQSHRDGLIAAALTLAQGWIADGQPRPSARPLGGYEHWSYVIGGILEHAGVQGFLDNLDELYERADTEGAAWRRFVAAWWERYQDAPVSVSELFSIAEAMDDFDLGRGKTERAQKTVLGKSLAKRRDMVLGGFRIEDAGIAHHTQQWRLSPTQRRKER